MSTISVSLPLWLPRPVVMSVCCGSPIELGVVRMNWCARWLSLSPTSRSPTNASPIIYSWLANMFARTHYDFHDILLTKYIFVASKFNSKRGKHLRAFQSNWRSITWCFAVSPRVSNSICSNPSRSLTFYYFQPQSPPQFFCKTNSYSPVENISPWSFHGRPYVLGARGWRKNATPRIDPKCGQTST